MIYLNELREGNFILPNNERFVESYNKKPIRYTKNTNYYFLDSDRIGGIYTKFYDPIQITGELLIKLGFKQKDQNNPCFDTYRNQNGFYVCISKHTDEIVKEGAAYCEEYTEIPSLHWLQNYYFFNHKSELIAEDFVWS